MQPGGSAGREGARCRMKADAMRAQAADLTRRADVLERYAGHWASGEQGEALVGSQLESLRTQGWEVLHDVRWPGRPRANIDHVAVGPPGVLVVDAKHWSGRVTVDAAGVRQNGRRRDRQVTSVAEQGTAVGSRLDLPWALHMIPTLCLSNSGADVAPRQLGPVTVVGVSQVTRWVSTLPTRMTPDDVQRIAQHLATALPPASLPRRAELSRAVPRPPGRGIARVSSPGRRRRTTRRRSRGLPGLLVRLALLLAFAAAAPTLVQWWADQGARSLSEVAPVPSLSVGPSPVQPATFEGCRALRADHPTGVKKVGASNTGRRIKRVGSVDTEVYRANRRLDRDRDGIACEVIRPRN